MIKLRAATSADSALILELIQALAFYEKLAHECYANEDLVSKWLFGETPRAYALIAHWGEEVAGFVLYFYNFSTFLAKPGIYIEDLFIKPEFRRRGIARAIFAHLAKKATAEGCGRLEWWVLDWNEDAIRFYESLGAEPMSEWTVQRISGNAFKRLAESV